MKKFFVALFMLLSVPAFATGVGSTASTADCNNATLNTYTGTSNLSAGWQPNTIDLHWYADSNATTAMNVANASQSCTYDGTLTPPATIPTKTGYTFKGWTVRGVPDGYTRLQYIQSTGTQYIDTNIYGDAGLSVFLVAQGTGDRGIIFGFDQDYSGSCVGDNGTSFFSNEIFSETQSLTKTNIETYWETNGSKLKQTTIINGVTQTYSNYGRTPRKITIFKGADWAAANSYWAGKLFSFIIKRNGSVILNLIPAKNSNNVVGMWDTVSKTFFTNAGTGSFTAGPVVQ